MPAAMFELFLQSKGARPSNHNQETNIIVLDECVQLDGSNMQIYRDPTGSEFSLLRKTIKQRTKGDFHGFNLLLVPNHLPCVRYYSFNIVIH